jgi:DNA polymerase III subunit delta
MIVKEFEFNKININNYNLYLLHGKNEGLKKEIISKIVSKNESVEIQKLDERQILENQELFMDEILSSSLFSNKKLIIINQATDKILKNIESIYDKKINGLILIINSTVLEKKSKLRSFFEKEKELICVPFYPDTTQTLSFLANKFFREKKISISQSNINLIINKCNGDREFLENELSKIELFLYKKKNIETYELSKLINLIENHGVSELVDSCLINNSKKVSLILNENNFNNEDCIIIIRTFLTKTKKILKLANNYAKNNNLEMTVAEAKPPIFWKEKEAVKLQLQRWKPDILKKLISNINQVELELKKNSQSSLSILMNFIFEQISPKA